MLHYDLSSIRCLLADDNSYTRQIIRMFLMGFGLRDIFEAGDGAAALEIYQSKSPDIILTDWEMPVLDGLELTRMLRNSETSPNPYVPIIMFTAYSDRKRVISARDAGVTEFLCKPVSAKALYQRLLVCVVSPRSFVRTKTFFGPDRRRFQMTPPDEDERRGTSEGESDAEITSVNAVLNSL